MTALDPGHHAALPSGRSQQWAATMAGADGPSGLIQAHAGPPTPVGAAPVVGRVAREQDEERRLAPGATRAVGGGQRAVEEEPDPERTCFERDRDRVLHATAFRRLAGKTQVVVYPADHQRTRLTHALEVTQVAVSVARAVGLNAALTEAVALAHDCGHGPGGHASEDAFDAYVPGGYHHAVWGADVVLTALNLTEQTLDGVRNHSWSRPAPATPEGAVVSWADRVAYCAHDLEDAVQTGIVDVGDLPADVAAVCGRTRREQLHCFINALTAGIRESGVVAMAEREAGALAGLRAFNYARIYTRPESLAQGRAVVSVLRALVDHLAEHPRRLPEPPPADPGSPAAVLAAVAHVAGMTDRYAFHTAVAELGWDPAALPRGVDASAYGGRGEGA